MHRWQPLRVHPGALSKLPRRAAATIHNYTDFAGWIEQISDGTCEKGRLSSNFFRDFFPPGPHVKAK
jgi:hypothetical protein